MEKKRIIPTLHYNGDDKTCPAVLVVDMCSYVRGRVTVWAQYQYWRWDQSLNQLLSPESVYWPGAASQTLLCVRIQIFSRNTILKPRRSKLRD